MPQQVHAMMNRPLIDSPPLIGWPAKRIYSRKSNSFLLLLLNKDIDIYSLYQVNPFMLKVLLERYQVSIMVSFKWTHSCLEFV